MSMLPTGVDVRAELRAALDGKRGIIFDYDGTITDLHVDWTGLRQALQTAAAGLGFESAFRPLWPELKRSEREGGPAVYAALLAVVARFEDAGRQTQVACEDVVAFLRHDLPTDVRVGVFSANLRSTVMAGLDQLGLRCSIDVIVAGDDVSRPKPDAEGLATNLRALDLNPDEALFVGDSDGDASAAAALGVPFFRVGTP